MSSAIAKVRAPALDTGKNEEELMKQI